MASQKTAKSQSAKASNVKSQGATPVPAKGKVVPPAPSQSELFEVAMENFHARNFKSAHQFFESAADGPSADIAHAARLHQRMCDQRLSRQQEEPHSAEDHYNLAVALLNRRNLPEAKTHLEIALKMSAQSDHLHYAMALLCGLEGNYAASAQALARAIQLDARNRSAARNDPDFSDILRHAELRTVLDAQEISTP